MNKREQQREERRQQILQCSLDMIISRGFEAMKIRDIAKELHISTGLFFNYFESKEKVYEELIRIGLHGPESVLKLNTGNIEPIEFFSSMTNAIFEALRENSFTAKMFILMAQTANSENLPEGVQRLISSMDAYTPVLPVIAEGQRKGQIRPGDPQALALAYWGAIQGIAVCYASMPGSVLPEPGWVMDILSA